MTSKPATPTPSFSPPPQQVQTQQPRIDPFASLNAPAPRQASPFQFQQSIQQPPAPSSSLLDLTGSNASQTPPVPSASIQQSNGAAAAGDDEWTFSSALPDSSHDLTVVHSSIHVLFHVSRQPTPDNVILIQSQVSNNTAQPISQLTFQLAVTKVSLSNRCLTLLSLLASISKLTSNFSSGLSTQARASVRSSPQPTSTTRDYTNDSITWGRAGPRQYRQDALESILRRGHGAQG